MKRWRLEVRAKDGKTSTGSVEAADPSAAMAKAVEKGFEVVKILGWEDLPLSPEPAAAPAGTMTPLERNRQRHLWSSSHCSDVLGWGWWLLSIGILLLVLAGVGVMAKNYGLAILVCSGGVLLLILGTICVAVGSLARDLAAWRGEWERRSQGRDEPPPPPR